MIVTLIVLGVWSLVAVIFGVIIGATIRSADEAEVGPEARDLERAA